MEPAQLVADALAERRLSTRDKRLKDSLGELGSSHFDQEAMAQDLTPQNIQELGRAIEAAKDPRQKAYLMEELGRLRDLASNLMGPVNPPPMLPGTLPKGGAMTAPYSPAQQAPGIYGGQRMNFIPAPRRM